ncbi:MAG: Gldg family protein [Polyangiaceae bacterium]|nr:Gldg family protein [Polyangiaceae bacterium]
MAMKKEAVQPGRHTPPAAEDDAVQPGPPPAAEGVETAVGDPTLGTGAQGGAEAEEGSHERNGVAAPAGDAGQGQPSAGLAAPPSDRPHPPRAAPIWVLALYLGGLVLVFLGQRVVVAFDTVPTVLTALGVGAVATATILRYSPRFRVGGERKQIETLLGLLSVAGLLALGVFFLTTEWAAERFGFYALDDQIFDRLNGVLTVLWIALAVVSILPMVFAETAAYPMRHAFRPESRRVRAAALAGTALALAAVYGSLFIFAARGLDWRADYSYFKTSMPSESTRSLIATLEEPVKVHAFFPDVNEVRSEVERYLRSAASGNPKIEVEIKDRLLMPEAAQKLRVTQDGVIVVAQGEKNEQLRLGVDLGKARPKLRTLDRDFQEKLLKLVRSRRTAYLTVGHGEINDTRGKAELSTRGASIVEKLLERQNYAHKDLGLAQGLATDIPPDADVVLVLGPSEPFAPEEIATLRRYAERGGKLLLALDPDAETNTEALLPSDGSTEDATKDEPDMEPAEPDPSGSATAAAASSAIAPGLVGSAAPPTVSANPPEETAPGGTGKRRFLSELAGIVGLSFDDRVLVNDKIHVTVRGSLSDRGRIVSNRFSSHASVSTLSRNSSRGAVVMLDGAGSLDRVSNAKQTIDFAVKSMQDTYRDKNRNYRYDPAAERRENYHLAAAVTAPATRKASKPAEESEPKDEAADEAKPEDAKDETSAKGREKAKQKDHSKPGENPADGELRAFVIADSGAFTDLVMANFAGNQLLLIDAIRWLTGEESVMGEISSEEDLRVEHTKQQDLVWFYSTIFGIPALVLGLGLLWGRRRQPKGAQ